MNIYQKLHKIQAQIIGLGKDKSSFSYKYVTGSKVLEHIKPLMNELGLLLKQEIISIENTRQDYSTKNGEKAEILTKAMMRFTWIDCETGDKDVNEFGANGQNDWEKGLGSALTYAERYFLLKYFHIATDEDDIDNPERETSKPVEVKKEATNAEEKPKAQLPVLNESNPNWAVVVQALKDKKTDINRLKQKYIIFDMIEKRLTEIVFDHNSKQELTTD